MNVRQLAPALIVLACAPEGSLPLGATCEGDKTCSAGLVCAFGRCREPCEDSATCTCLEASGCALAGEEQCGERGCVSQLTCAADDVCRVPCSASEDCALGHVCVEGACFASPPEFLPGWVFYSGSDAIWALREDGSQRVRLSEGGGAEDVRLSPSAEKLVFLRDGDVRMMASDGSGLATLATANGGCDWYADSQALLCSRAADCSSELVKIGLHDVATEILWTAPTRETFPALNPEDDDDIVFVSKACSSASRVRRRTHGSESDVTAIPLGQAQTVGWDRDGSRFVYAEGNVVMAVDAKDTSAGHTLLKGAPGSSFGSPTLGDHDGLFVTQPGVGVVRFGPGQGPVYTLGGAPLAGSRLSWGRPPFELDRDDDGLGNGIDPTPDGLQGCGLSPRERTVGLWCLKEGQGATSGAESSGLPAITGIAHWDASGGIRFDQSFIADSELLDLTPPYSVRMRVRLGQLGLADAVLFSRATWVGAPVDGDNWWLELRVRPNGSVLCSAGNALDLTSAESFAGLVSSGKAHELGCRRGPSGALRVLVDRADATAAQSGASEPLTVGLSGLITLGWSDAPASHLPGAPFAASGVLSALAIDRE